MHCRTTVNTTNVQNRACMAGIRKASVLRNRGDITVIVSRYSAVLLVDFRFEVPALLSFKSYTKR